VKFALDRATREAEMKTTSGTTQSEFSLVQGGLLFQTCRRAHLSGEGLELLTRRVLIVTLFVWLPLLFLSMLDGHAFGGTIKIPFAHDVEANVRFLIALPLLIIAEVTVHHRLGSAVRKFVERCIVVKENVPRFDAAVISTLRTRDSFTLEMLLFVLAYTLGLWIWRSQVALGTATWYASPDAEHVHLTLAGDWYAYVSIPIFQFILLRWYMRLVLWFRFLWQVSRLDLRLSAAHPDLAGGIGFLGRSSYSFGPFLFAQGALLSGVIASRVLYDGQSLQSFKMEAAGCTGFFLLVVLGPLVMFTPHLVRAQREGRSKYGLLANRYVFGFEDKWLQDKVPATSELLGTPDLQALADLGNSYAVVRRMRLVPFGLDDVTRLAYLTAAPLLPLALTIVPLEQLMSRLVKILFL
jgi:hypothetical protein